MSIVGRALVAALAIAGCSAAPAPTGSPVPRGGDREAAYGPLEVGADFARYRKVSPAPFRSLAHGDRWVEVYVNAIGADAYVSTGAIPVGTVVVKTSWQNEGGRPGPAPGPMFVMEKRAPGYDPEHGDWFYAIHWARPVGRFAKAGPIYWRGRSPRVAYCYDGCHEAYDRGLGGLIPSSLLPR